MTQLRHLPPMAVLEPVLSRNHAVCPIFGSGDLTKLTRNYSTRFGELRGGYGVARLPNIADHYNTRPFGDLAPLPPQPPVTTQRGFYDQEFTTIKFGSDHLGEREERRGDNLSRDRDTESPDTIVSSSSPECVMPETPPKYPGTLFFMTYIFFIITTYINF